MTILFLALNCIVCFCAAVLPAGAVDMAWGSAAEASDAVLPGFSGSLHRSDPHLRLPAPPIRRANGLHTGSPHCLLGGQYTLSITVCPLVKVCWSSLSWGWFCPCVFRPSTSHPCLNAPVRLCLRLTPWTAPCHPTTLSAEPHPPPAPACTNIHLLPLWSGSDRWEILRMWNHFLWSQTTYLITQTEQDREQRQSLSHLARGSKERTYELWGREREGAESYTGALCKQPWPFVLDWLTLTFDTYLWDETEHPATTTTPYVTCKYIYSFFTNWNDTVKALFDFNVSIINRHSMFCTVFYTNM